MMVSSITLVISILSLKEEPSKDSYWIDTQYLDVDTTETEDGSDTDDDFYQSASEDDHVGQDAPDAPGQEGPDNDHHDDSSSMNHKLLNPPLPRYTNQTDIPPISLP